LKIIQFFEKHGTLVLSEFFLINVHEKIHQ